MADAIFLTSIRSSWRSLEKRFSSLPSRTFCESSLWPYVTFITHWRIGNFYRQRSINNIHTHTHYKRLRRGIRYKRNYRQEVWTIRRAKLILTSVGVLLSELNGTYVWRVLVSTPLRPRNTLLPRRSIDLWVQPRGFETDLSQRIRDDHQPPPPPRIRGRLDLCEFRLDPCPTTTGEITQAVRLTLKMLSVSLFPCPYYSCIRRAIEI